MANTNPTLPTLTPQQVKCFRAKIAVRSEDECWLWQGMTAKGYGTYDVRINGRAWRYRAHRIAYMLHHGKDPGEMLVRHTCDVRACCNPRHLRPGTHQQNMNDMRERGRAASGERHGSRLHPERVARGERHGSRTHPERLQRGEGHYLRRNPERALKGNKHPSKLHPESVCRGERNGNSKLTEEQAREIASKYVPRKYSLNTLAREYQVSKRTILFIVQGKHWKHLAL